MREFTAKRCSELMIFPLVLQGDEGHLLIECRVSRLALLVILSRHVSELLLEVRVCPGLEVAGDGTTCQLVQRLDLELFAIDEQLFQTFYIVLHIEAHDGLEFNRGHVLLQLVVGSWEHDSRHDFEIIKLLAVVNDNAQEVIIDLKLQACSVWSSAKLVVDEPTHKTDFPRHGDGLLCLR